MKTLPAGMQTHLDSGATTLCWCWRLTRSDGVKLGFTDHDRDLSFDATTFKAATGFTASEIKGSVGLNVDNLDVTSALRSDALNEDDLAAGLYDDARIEIFRINWQDTAQRLLMRLGSLGEVKRGELAFTAEVRGLAHYLQQPKGRTYQYACDADLGDARCTINLNLAAYKGAGAVLSVEAANRFRASGLDSFAGDWFSRGKLAWTSGPNNGRSMEVKRHAKTGGAVIIELWHLMPDAIAIGNGFTITAGCDKQFSTCKAKFNNGLNFRGFPHIPGNDFVVSYPNSGDPRNNGRSRV